VSGQLHAPAALPPEKSLPENKMGMKKLQNEELHNLLSSPILEEKITCSTHEK
jgi:hypothetical protein